VIEAPESAALGSAITVAVGKRYSGQEVSAYLFSDPVLLGTRVVSAAGAIQVTIPASAAAASHRIAVYDAAGALIGWDTITLTSAPGGGDLEYTGAFGAGRIAGVALALTACGAVLLVAARRRRSAALEASGTL
jgi:hypothetical protein